MIYNEQLAPGHQQNRLHTVLYRLHNTEQTAHQHATHPHTKQATNQQTHKLQEATAGQEHQQAAAQQQKERWGDMNERFMH
ncbi:hypothetical protein SOVF_051510 [Spinacia oleracea]|nr:hypothetical protein SOVF_051510 [Spinacia oleracea]